MARRGPQVWHVVLRHVLFSTTVLGRRSASIRFSLPIAAGATPSRYSVPMTPRACHEPRAQSWSGVKRGLELAPWGRWYIRHMFVFDWGRSAASCSEALRRGSVLYYLRSVVQRRRPYRDPPVARLAITPCGRCGLLVLASTDAGPFSVRDRDC